MIMIIVLVFLISVYMMVAGQMKQDAVAYKWGLILCLSTAFMLITLWFFIYRPV